MEIMDVLRKRYSVRKFLPKEIEEEKINLILEAGRIAPSAHNLQPVFIRILKGEDTSILKEATPYLYHAPVLFVVCYDREKAWTREFDQMNMGIVDASITATQMMLEIVHLGLGSVWVGHFDPIIMKEKLGLKSTEEVVCILPVGYPSPEYQPSSSHFERKPMEEFVK